MPQPHRIDDFNEKQQIHFSVVLIPHTNVFLWHRSRISTWVRYRLHKQNRDKRIQAKPWLRKQVKQKTNVRGWDTDVIKRRSRRQLYSGETLITEREEAEDDYTRSETLITEREEAEDDYTRSETLIRERGEAEDHCTRVRHWSQKEEKQRTTVPE